MACGSRWCATWAVLCSTVVLAGAVVFVGWLWFSTPVDLADGRQPELDSQRGRVLLAIGDSFMSGEGTDLYLPGTTSADNLCHRSPLAYPYQIAEAMDMRLVFAACSGATTRHVLGVSDAGTIVGQYPESPAAIPGARPQIELLSRSPLHSSVDDVGVVILSIGGNDAGFGEIVKTCLYTDCQPKWNEWMAHLDEAAQRIGEVHRTIARTVKPGTRVLVTLYPAPIIAAECGALGEQLSRSEVRWILDTFLARLNYVIEYWARGFGFEVVDLSHAFDGARICEVEPDHAASTVFNIRRNDVLSVRRLVASGRQSFDSSAQGSFHPNARGHLRMKAAVLATLAQPVEARAELDVPPAVPPGFPPLVASGFPPPAPGIASPPAPGVAPEATLGAPLAPNVGPPGGVPAFPMEPPPTPPPHVSSIVGVPTGEEVPAGLSCRGRREGLTERVFLSAPAPSYRLLADPGSPVCYRAESEEWVDAVVSDAGTFDVPLGALNSRGQSMEVWYSKGQVVSKVGIHPEFVVTPPALVLGRTMRFRLVVSAFAALVVVAAAIHLGYCLVCRRRATRAV